MNEIIKKIGTKLWNQNTKYQHITLDLTKINYVVEVEILNSIDTKCSTSSSLIHIFEKFNYLVTIMVFRMCNLNYRDNLTLFHLIALVLLKPFKNLN